MTKIAFVCIHNSCRSQMAEAWGHYLSNDYEFYSAGTERYKEVKPLAVEVMNEIGINMDEHYPKLLSEIPNDIDILITMGCGVECPSLPVKHREDWGLEDPSGGPIEDFRKTRDIIKEKTEKLIDRIQSGEFNL